MEEGEKTLKPARAEVKFKEPEKMVLDPEIKEQLSQYLQLLENDVLFKVHAGTDETSQKMLDFLNEIAEMSPKLSVERAELSRKPSFSVNRPGEDTGIVFAGIPLGHEFTSFVLAVLQVSGRPPKIDDSLKEQIKALSGKYHFETYVN